MLMTWNNDRAPTTDIVDGARNLVVDAINRLKAATALDPMLAVDALTIEQENELELLSCWY